MFGKPSPRHEFTLHSAAKGRSIKKVFSHHADETRDQIFKLSLVFTELGFDESSAPSPATAGIKKQASSLMEMAD